MQDISDLTIIQFSILGGRGVGHLSSYAPESSVPQFRTIDSNDVKFLVLGILDQSGLSVCNLLQGDIGSPLVHGFDGIPKVVAIATNINSNCRKTLKKVAVFTLVGPYFDWIRGTLHIYRTVSSYHLFSAVLNWFT